MRGFSRVDFTRFVNERRKRRITETPRAASACQIYLNTSPRHLSKITFSKHHKYCPNLVYPKKPKGFLNSRSFSISSSKGRKVFLNDVGVLQQPKIIFRFGISINTGLGLDIRPDELRLIMKLRYYSIIITDEFGIKHRANKGPWCWTLLPLAPHSLVLPHRLSEFTSPPYLTYFSDIEVLFQIWSSKITHFNAKKRWFSLKIA